MGSAAYASRGNQVKWKVDNMFIKLDCLGYESIAEEFVSHLLGFTDIATSDYVEYYRCYIYEDDVFLGNGCFSYDYTNSHDEISIADILDLTLTPYSIKYDDLLLLLHDYTGEYFKRYIDRILCIDAITRNEDRHFGNISFLFDNGKYYPSPIFDNGASCMSDVITYPMSSDLNINFKRLTSKPFKANFTGQLFNVAPILINDIDFFKSIKPETEEEFRALEVIRRGLKETEGLAWERC